MKKFAGVIKDNLFSIFVVSLVALVNAAIIFLIPVSVSSLLNAQLNVKTIVLLFALVFASLILSVILTNIQQKFICRFKYKLNKQLYEVLFHTNYAALSKNGATYYVDKILTAVNSYADFIMSIIPSFIQIWAVIIVAAAIIGYISIPILVLVVVTLVIQNRGYSYINKKLSKMCVRLQNVCARSFGNVVSVFDKTDYIKQSSGCEGILKLIDKDIKDAHQVTSEVNIFAGSSSYILGAFVENMQYITYIILAFMMIGGDITTSEFVLGTMVVNICFSYVGQLVKMSINMKDVNASWDFVENELKKETEESGTMEIGEINSVQLKHTRIAYADNELVTDVCVSLKKGDVVYLKAETGTGKSSLVKTLVGFQQANGIFFNDVPLEQISLGSLRSRVCYVSQQNAVINGSLADNVFMGAQIDEEKEKEISALKFFEKFVEDGHFKEWDFSSSGANLSGGDKQKIMISRLFVENPDVLILDEITSSMDEESANIVFGEIMERFSDKIIIIISHNQYIQKYANRQFLIEDKQLKEVSVKQ